MLETHLFAAGTAASTVIGEIRAIVVRKAGLQPFSLLRGTKFSEGTRERPRMTPKKESNEAEIEKDIML